VEAPRLAEQAGRRFGEQFHARRLARRAVLCL
jgi:hypothetical protein